MKHSSRTLIGVCTLCLLAFVRTDNESDLIVNKNKMHDAVKSMLGFSEGGDMPHPSDITGSAPRYMLDLYDRFKNGPISKGRAEGNTVRSIEAKIETVDGQAMFVFNLSSLASTEKIISAEIHIEKRKIRYNRKSSFELLLHEISPQKTILRGEMLIRPDTYGWQLFDVTNTIKSCFHGDKTSAPNSFGLNFKVIKPHGNLMVYLKRFVSQHSVPYLIVYSNDMQNVDLEQFDKLSDQMYKFNNEKSPIKDDSNVDIILPERTKRNKRSVMDNSADIPIYQSRARSLSILTNEIPEDPADYDRPYPINIKTIQTHPGMLQTRKESRHRLTDPSLIPYPGEYVEKRRRKKMKNKRKKGKRRKNHLELPKEWEDLQELAEEEKSTNLCSKKKLVVDFNDIGWGEWIISPKSFKAHYCSGACTFPLTKKMRPSNHATIQSLVNAVGINPDVPAPCCVPDKLASITLLYFDQNSNVVLKNYPNMTVQKCACR
ncbi:Bone morphogenetic protein 3 [Mactra antiquata]